jgi:hypothetical protein
MKLNLVYIAKFTTILFCTIICIAYSQDRDVYSIGDTIKNDGIALIVISVAGRTEVGGTLFKSTPSEGAVYVAVQYKYKNISTKSIGTFSKPSLKLIDPYGNKYDVDVNASSCFGSENKDNEKIISDLNPGITSKASCVFEVSSDLLNKSPWELVVTIEDKDYRITSLWNKSDKRKGIDMVSGNKTLKSLSVIGPNELDTSDRCNTRPAWHSNCDCDSLPITVLVVPTLPQEVSQL